MKRTLVLLGLVFVVAAASPAFASDIILPVGNTGAYALGEAFSHSDLGGAGCGAECRESTLVNDLIGLNINQRTVRTATVVPEYYRSGNTFASLPLTNKDDGFVETSFTMSNGYVQIIITQPYLYLVAAYDGPGGGSQAWYIGDISAGNTLFIPRNAYVTGTAYNGSTGGYNLAAGTDGGNNGLTSWSVWSPTTVPDGGATVALLGLALVGLGVARRRLGR